MALSRRSGTRFQGSIWPGFVDAMTGLLLVLMFLQKYSAPNGQKQFPKDWVSLIERFVLDVYVVG